MSTHEIGDRGQRFEIRYRVDEEMIGPFKVLGWAQTREGARKMVNRGS